MVKAETITSAANPLLKEVRRAIARGGLTEHGWCVAESFHLLEEALRSRLAVNTVLAAASARHAVEARLSTVSGIKLLVLPDPLLQSISATENSQGVIALATPPEWNRDDVFGANPLVVVLDGIQDPGNAGTIIRAAEAFGATGALFVKGTVSPYNPKTLRASAGSLFRLPFVAGIEEERAYAECRHRGVTLFAGLPARRDAKPLTAADLTGSCAFVIGNEARGVGAGLQTAAVGIYIPTVGVESLNAAIAAAILLYEARRQRTAHP